MSPWKVSTVALTFAVGVVAGATLVPSAHAGEQPAMQSALDHLRAAKSALESATHDKGGHRVKAIGATTIAIHEVQAGIDFDNQHPEPKPGGPTPKPPGGPTPKPPGGPTPK